MAVVVSAHTGWGIPSATLGGRKIGTCTITFDASYLSGGETFAATAIPGLNKLDVLVQIGGTTGGYVIHYDYTNELLIAYWVDTTVDGAPLKAVTSTTNLSAVAPKFLYIGS